MSNVGIPTWVFQLQPRNSKAREPTIILFILQAKKNEKMIVIKKNSVDSVKELESISYEIIKHLTNKSSK